MIKAKPEATPEVKANTVRNYSGSWGILDRTRNPHYVKFRTVLTL
jgi:hypothetical protein